ncbi:MAG: hypothetical protein J6Z79_07760 [Clostridia bacterium]|nr:hypothetical protein [Clostridia bacterium]
MHHPVNNIMYATTENLRNTLRFAIFLREPIEIEAMKRAAAQTAARFPYFAVRMIRRGESYVFEANRAPFVFSNQSAPVRLNSAESNYHLLAFCWENNRLYLDTTHFLTDGNGIFPFVRTLLYCYFCVTHPEENFDTSCIALPGEDIPEAELEYNPYPEETIRAETMDLRHAPEEIFKLPGQETGYENMENWTAYFLRIPQKESMRYVSSVDGSPATFVSSLIYRAIDDLYPDNTLPIVCGMQHQFRHALGKPQSLLCHVNLAPIRYPVSLRGADIERLNTIGRGSLILRADDASDLITVNAHIQNEKAIRDMDLARKRDYMRRVVLDGIGDNTFEVSYTGRVPWGGLDRYVSYLAPYLDMTLSGGVSVEIFSRGTDFDICIMQRNKDERIVNRVKELLTEIGIQFFSDGAEPFAIPTFETPS